MPNVEQSSQQATLLAKRRALLGDPLSVQVISWLGPLYQGPTAKRPGVKATAAVTETLPILSKMVSAVGPEVKNNKEIQTGLQGVVKFMSSPLNATYSAAFNAVKRPNSTVLGTFVSVVYARALVLLLSTPTEETGKILPDLATTLRTPGSAISGHVTAQQKLDPNFVGHLVTYSEIEAQIDPHFDMILTRGGKLFFETHRPDAKATNPLTDAKSDLHVLQDSTSWMQLPTTIAFAMTLAS